MLINECYGKPRCRSELAIAARATDSSWSIADLMSAPGWVALLYHTRTLPKKLAPGAPTFLAAGGDAQERRESF